MQIEALGEVKHELITKIVLENILSIYVLSVYVAPGFTYCSRHIQKLGYTWKIYISFLCFY